MPELRKVQVKKHFSWILKCLIPGYLQQKLYLVLNLEFLLLRIIHLHLSDIFHSHLRCHIFHSGTYQKYLQSLGPERQRSEGSGSGRCLHFATVCRLSVHVAAEQRDELGMA